MSKSKIKIKIKKSNIKKSNLKKKSNIKKSKLKKQNNIKKSKLNKKNNIKKSKLRKIGGGAQQPDEGAYVMIPIPGYIYRINTDDIIDIAGYNFTCSYCNKTYTSADLIDNDDYHMYPKVSLGDITLYNDICWRCGDNSNLFPFINEYINDLETIEQSDILLNNIKLCAKISMVYYLNQYNDIFGEDYNYMSLLDKFNNPENIKNILQYIVDNFNMDNDDQDRQIVLDGLTINDIYDRLNEKLDQLIDNDQQMG